MNKEHRRKWLHRLNRKKWLRRLDWLQAAVMIAAMALALAAIMQS